MGASRIGVTPPAMAMMMTMVRGVAVVGIIKEFAAGKVGAAGEGVTLLSRAAHRESRALEMSRASGVEAQGEEGQGAGIVLSPMLIVASKVVRRMVVPPALTAMSEVARPLVLLVLCNTSMLAATCPAASALPAVVCAAARATMGRQKGVGMIGSSTSSSRAPGSASHTTYALSAA